MILPGSFTLTLILAIVGMLLWGSWANTFKLRPAKWRFELYCFDFAIGAVIAAILLAFTLGNLGYDGFSVMDDLQLAGKRQEVFALIAGMLFALGNMLLIGAMSISGMAVAFPIGMGVAVVVGAVLTYVPVPHGNIVVLMTGAVIAAGAIATAAVAYRNYSAAQLLELVQQGKTKSTRKAIGSKAIFLSAIGGLFLGVFYPIITFARTGENGLGPYSAIMISAFGVVAGTVVFNLFFMNLPVQGDPVDIAQYLRAKARTHSLGIAGGIAWAVGAVLLSVAGRAEGAAALNPAILSAMLQAGVIVATLWGMYRWHEYQGSDTKVKFLTTLTLILLVIGVTLTSYSQLDVTH